MSVISTFEALLRAPVGNNLENRPDDVQNIKNHFAAEGRYKRKVDNGYIDQDLDDSIWSFQRENNLKVDGIMNPGGETEAALIGKRLKLPDYPEPKQEKGFQKVNAVPLFKGLALGLGMSAAGAAQWWKNQSAEDRDKITRSLDYSLNGDAESRDPKDRCDKINAENMSRCAQVYRQHGKDAGRICEQTAMTQYSQCLAGKPEEDWRKLHTTE